MVQQIAWPVIASLVGAGLFVLLAYGLYHPERQHRPPPPVVSAVPRDEAARRSLLAGAWMQVRGRLLQSTDAEAARWAQQLDPLIASLRPSRENVDPTQTERALLIELEGHPEWIAIPGVRAQADQIARLLDQ